MEGPVRPAAKRGAGLQEPEAIQTAGSPLCAWDQEDQPAQHYVGLGIPGDGSDARCLWSG